MSDIVALQKENAELKKIIAGKGCALFACGDGSPCDCRKSYAHVIGAAQNIIDVWDTCRHGEALICLPPELDKLRFALKYKLPESK